jgi:aminopeptidase N
VTLFKVFCRIIVSELSQFIEFVARYPPENAAEEAVYERAFEIVSENRRWADNNLLSLHEWLESNVLG